MLIDFLVSKAENPQLVNPTVNIPVIAIATITLIALGTLIGLIPAQTAVSIKPIDALREE